MYVGGLERGRGGIQAYVVGWERGREAYKCVWVGLKGGRGSKKCMWVGWRGVGRHKSVCGWVREGEGKGKIHLNVAHLFK